MQSRDGTNSNADVSAWELNSFVRKAECACKRNLANTYYNYEIHSYTLQVINLRKQMKKQPGLFNTKRNNSNDSLLTIPEQEFLALRKTTALGF